MIGCEAGPHLPELSDKCLGADWSVMSQSRRHEYWHLQNVILSPRVPIHAWTFASAYGRSALPGGARDGQRMESLGFT